MKHYNLITEELTPQRIEKVVLFLQKVIDIKGTRAKINAEIVVPDNEESTVLTLCDSLGIVDIKPL